jgi:hypothetical protein
MDKAVVKKIPPKKTGGIIYMDGLVSTGNKFPNTILKRIFAIQKCLQVSVTNGCRGVVFNCCSLVCKTAPGSTALKLN